MTTNTDAGPSVLPQPVIDALRFYAHGHHYNIDDDHQQFDTVSGEPVNWLHSEREDDCTMIEDGGIARAVLRGVPAGFEEPPEPIEGEAFAAPLPRVAATVALTDAQIDKWAVEHCVLTHGVEATRAAARALLAASNGEQEVGS